MEHSLLADLIVAVHAAYIGFVVLGQAAILAGAAAGWRWVRNFWFRLAHLLAIGIVAVQSILGLTCPLTTWEDQLRGQTGQGTFIGRWLHYLIFYQAEPWVFTTVYVGFALLVIGTLWLVPPRRARA